jgi:hypothetical protein
VPVRLIAVMDEAVLHRRVGSEDTRREPLEHLAEQGRRKHIGIQVVPSQRGSQRRARRLVHHREPGRRRCHADAPWRKSTYSANGGQDCVEVAGDKAVLVRDTTNRDGGTLTFSAKAWQTFVNGIK